MGWRFFGGVVALVKELDDGMLRVRDFVGAEYLAREVDVLGVGGDSAACARFDRAFLEALEERGIRSAYALKKAAGLGYDTAQAAMECPHDGVTRRVFLTVCGNLDIDMAGIEARATVDAGREAFERAYKLAQEQVAQLLDAFLRLDARTQNVVRKQVAAAGGVRYPSYDGGAHEDACRRLREQLWDVISLRPDGRIDVVDDIDAPDGKAQEARWTGRTIENG